MDPSAPSPARAVRAGGRSGWGRGGADAGPVRRSAALHLLLVVLVAAAAACGGDREFEPPDREAQVERARQAYPAGVFDTLSWPSDSVRVHRGNEVFAAECRRCHGYDGRGGTDYARAHDIRAPSLVDSVGVDARGLDAVRRRVYAGHAAGMPSFGAFRLEPRQVDAAAAYVVRVLRD